MIKAVNLVKTFGDVKAVEGISFEIGKGEILGLLGPNGAGKTTTMKMVTGTLVPTAGTISVANLDYRTEPFKIKDMIGYLPENNPLYEDLTVKEYLSFIVGIRKIKASLRAKKDELFDLFDLKGVENILISELSKGFKQRIGLASALLHDPSVLVLDEPVSGLDPNQITETREFIKRVGKDKTIIISSHILSEIEETCSRVLIIYKGKIVADGSTVSLKNNFEDIIITLKIKGNPLEIFARLSSLNGLISIAEEEKEEDEITSYILKGSFNKEIRESLFDLCVKNNFKLLELNYQQTKLEQIFRNLTVGD